MMMNTKAQVRDSWIGRWRMRLILISLLLAMTGCAPAATPAPLSDATQTPIIEIVPPSGWETYTVDAQCGYAISYPHEMDITSMVTNSWSITFTSTEPSGPDVNFIYISVIPDDFQGGPGEIYNYDPDATEILLNMQVGESKSVHPDPNFALGFTYTRLPDATLSNQPAQTYENNQPWEFPAGAKEIRYYLQANGCTYMIGGYVPTLDSGEPRTMSQELFEQIIAMFKVSQ